jgi:hypothetical protein
MLTIPVKFLSEKVKPMLTNRKLWRLGQHHKVHVYEGEEPIATFHKTENARQAVEDHNRCIDLDKAQGAFRVGDIVRQKVSLFHMSGEVLMLGPVLKHGKVHYCYLVLHDLLGASVIRLYCEHELELISSENN